FSLCTSQNSLFWASRYVLFESRFPFRFHYAFVEFSVIALTKARDEHHKLPWSPLVAELRGCFLRVRFAPVLLPGFVLDINCFELCPGRDVPRSQFAHNYA